MNKFSKLLGFLVVLALSSQLTGCSQVDTGCVGVVTSWGAVESQPLPEGLNAIAPWKSVTKINTQLLKAEAQAVGQSQDLQVVHTAVQVTYSVTGSLAPLVFDKIGTPDDVTKNIIDPGIQESVKAATAGYTAEDLVKQREKVKLDIEGRIKNFIATTLSSRKELTGAILINNVAIKDFAFSDEFNKAIEAKVSSSQKAQQAEQEAKKLITQAQAAAEQKKLEADAEAVSIEKTSIAKAAAITRESDALKDNPYLVQLRTIEKWDGNMPQYNSGKVPFIHDPSGK